MPIATCTPTSFISSGKKNGVIGTASPQRPDQGKHQPLRSSVMKMRVLLVLCTFAVPVAVNAVTITYDFSATPDAGGPLTATETGTFSFNSGIIPAGGGMLNETNLFTALSFTFNSVPYTAATANTASLTFDASGNLTGVFFGTDCAPNACGVSTGTNGWNLQGGSGTLALLYVIPSDPVLMHCTSHCYEEGFGTYSLQPPAVVPIPASAWFMLSGLGGLGAFARVISRRRFHDSIAKLRTKDL